MTLNLAILRVKEVASRGYQKMPDALLYTEKAARAMSSVRPLDTKSMNENRADFLDRANKTQIDLLKPSEMRRLLRTAWEDNLFIDLTGRALQSGLARCRKSFDESIIYAYLAYFPTKHPAFNELVAAVKLVAERHEWPWRTQGQHLSLWSPEEGPNKVGKDLINHDEDPIERMRSYGFGGEAMQFAFVKACLNAACRVAADSQALAAEKHGIKLISLVRITEQSALPTPLLVYALLKPWIKQNPNDNYKKQIISYLVENVGDPRLETARWDYIRSHLKSEFSSQDVEDALGIFRRWIVQTAVRQFFDIVSKTTGNTTQWQARTKFWLAYLDAGYIKDAWFAFGPQAKVAVRKIVNVDDSLHHGLVSAGSGTDANHSALLMSIGDLRIAEWSHNGACRFWNESDRTAPSQYQKEYSTLKAMQGGEGFENISHTGNWESRFASVIFKRTKIAHPIHGKGRLW